MFVVIDWQIVLQLYKIYNILIISPDGFTTGKCVRDGITNILLLAYEYTNVYLVNSAYVFHFLCNVVY